LTPDQLTHQTSNLRPHRI